MKITVRSEIALPGVSAELAEITNYAEVAPEDVEYDDVGHILRIKIARRRIVGFKTAFLSRRQIPLYAPNEWVLSIVTIRRVLKFEMKTHLIEKDEPVNLLFGISLSMSEVYLCSAAEGPEEGVGVIPCLEIRAETQAIDWELSDE